MKIEGFPEIITEGYPRLMEVWDNEKNKDHPCHRIVIAKVPTFEYPYKTLDVNGSVTGYINAEDIPTNKQRTIEDGLIEGDIIVTNNRESLVLGVCGKVIFISESDNFEEVRASAYTLYELINQDYKLKQETIPEMTMEEVCAALGRKIKIKK